DPQGRRSSAPVPNLSRPRRGHDDNGAVAGGAGAHGAHHTGHGLRALLPYGRFAAVFGLTVALEPASLSVGRLFGPFGLTDAHRLTRLHPPSSECLLQKARN